VVQGPPAWHPAPDEVKDAARRAAEAASKHGVDIAKLAIMEAVQQRGVATSLIGFATPEQARFENCVYCDRKRPSPGLHVSWFQFCPGANHQRLWLRNWAAFDVLSQVEVPSSRISRRIMVCGKPPCIIVLACVTGQASAYLRTA